jgi:hypothetical protein
VKSMKHLIMQISPTSCHFVSVRSKYSPQHPVLKHPQSVFLPYWQKPSFTPIPSTILMSENVGASTSRNPKGLHGLYKDNFTFTFTYVLASKKIFG